MKKVWIITGSSKGLGKSLVEAVLEKGDYVVATARNPQQFVCSDRGDEGSFTIHEKRTLGAYFADQLNWRKGRECRAFHLSGCKIRSRRVF